MSDLTPQEEANLRAMAEWELAPKVWTIEWSDYDDHAVVSIWTTKELAEAALEDHPECYLGCYLLDGAPDPPSMPMYRARLVGQDSRIEVDHEPWPQQPFSATAHVRRRQVGAKKPYEGEAWGVTREQARIKLYEALIAMKP